MDGGLDRHAGGRSYDVRIERGAIADIGGNDHSLWIGARVRLGVDDRRPLSAMDAAAVADLRPHVDRSLRRLRSSLRPNILFNAIALGGVLKIQLSEERLIAFSGVADLSTLSRLVRVENNSV